MEKIIVDGEEIMVEEREELETPVSSITVEEKAPEMVFEKDIIVSWWSNSRRRLNCMGGYSHV